MTASDLSSETPHALACGKSLSYVNDESFGEFRTLEVLTIRSVISAAPFLVVHVVLRCPEIDMRRIHARRIVALVKNLFSFWNVSLVREDPSHA